MTLGAALPPPRREGDAVSIPGDYQYRALAEGPAIQQLWHRVKLNLLDWFYVPAAGARIADIGCGSGVFANALAERGARAVALDANPLALAFIKKTFHNKPIAPVRALLDELPFRKHSFDGAVCLEVVEHVHAPQARALLAGLRELLRPGGTLLLTTPNYRGLWPAVEWLADRSGRVARMDAGQHVTRFHRKMLVQFLAEAGFVNIQIRAFSTFAPFAAPLSRALALRLERLERRVDLPFGNILAAKASAPVG